MDTVVVPKALKILNLCVFWYNRDHIVHCLPKYYPQSSVYLSFSAINQSNFKSRTHKYITFYLFKHKLDFLNVFYHF